MNKDSIQEAYKVATQIVELLENYNKNHPYDLLILSLNEIDNNDSPGMKPFRDSVNNSIKFYENLLRIGVTNFRDSGFLPFTSE
ncbi:hypothetical protein [Edaphocola flava]|uniref:hypothetical protein n=1 Tax=Edaphocola flava TaxID=2499629 RepID=UPI00138739B5|nr:hypothetical protein [Edaphocola flava]